MRSKKLTGGINSVDETTVTQGLISPGNPLREHCPLMTGGFVSPLTSSRAPSQRLIGNHFYWLVRHDTKAQKESVLSQCPHAAPNTPQEHLVMGALKKNTEWTRRGQHF